MAPGNGPTVAQRLMLLVLNVLLVLSNALSRAKRLWGMRKKEKRSPRRAKGQMEKPSAEQSRRPAPCKRPTPHSSPELILSPSWATSPPTERGMKEPAPTLETCASAKATSREDLWRLHDTDSVGSVSSRVSVSSGSSYYVDMPEGRLRMPNVCSVGSLSSRVSASSGSSYYIDIPEGRLQMPKICSPGPPLSSSSTDTLLEHGPAAMVELFAQECSGPAQSPKDDQGLITTAGGHETLPKERPQPPTCREAEVKLRHPGGKMQLNGQRVELPRGNLDTDNALHGHQIRRNNVAPHRSARLWQGLKACWQRC